MFFLPIAFIIFILFILFLPFLAILIYFQIITLGFEKLGISPEATLLTLFIILVGIVSALISAVQILTPHQFCHRVYWRHTVAE